MSSTFAADTSQMNSGLTDSVFPLSLSDFEYYMLVDDRPSHPMVFVMVVRLTGCLDREVFQRAVLDAVRAHPLFDCHVRSVPGRGMCWVPVADGQIRVNWQKIPSGSGPDSPAAVYEKPVPLKRIDIRQSRGLEVCVDESDSFSRVIFYLHHACCDGIGGLQFAGEVLARYGRLQTSGDERQPEFEETKREVLLLRERFDGGTAAIQKQQKSLRRSIAKAARLILRRPVALRNQLSATAHRTGSADPHENDLAGQAIRTAVLPRSVSRSLQRMANQRKVSVNDLLIREMLLQIHQWNGTSQAGQTDPWLRIAVPVSMRTSEHLQIPAANLVSYAFVTRRSSECCDPETLLASIHQQTADVHFNREGMVFLRCIRALRRVPGALRALLNFKSCFCTVVLANVGEIRRRFAGRFPLQNGRWKAGNVVVEQICGVAPVRPNTRAAVTIGEYGGELCIHLRTDSTAFSAAESSLFLDQFRQRLDTLARQQPDADEPQGTDESQEAEGQQQGNS